jgi:hypothetical protein
VAYGPTHNDAMCAAVVAASDGAEALLACRVPLRVMIAGKHKGYMGTVSAAGRQLTICSLITLPSSSTVRIFCKIRGISDNLDTALQS